MEQREKELNFRAFKGVWITREIWLDKRLNATEKVLLAEIWSLDNDLRGCTASNQYFAEFCGVSEKTISRGIQKLIDLGYIELAHFDGRKRHLKWLDASHRQNVCLDNLSKRDRKNVQQLKKHNKKAVETPKAPLTMQEWLALPEDEALRYKAQEAYDRLMRGEKVDRFDMSLIHEYL